MSKAHSSTLADWLKEFPCMEKQDGAYGPLLTQSGETAAGSTLKFGTAAAEKSGEQVNAQLLEAITASNTSLTGKMEEIQVDIGLMRHDMQRVRERVAETEENLHYRR